MADIIQVRRDTVANWASVNPVLRAGELGLELQVDNVSYKIKVGDGTTAWNTLPYLFQTTFDVKANKYTATIGDGVATIYTVTHNLNTKDVTVKLRNTSTDAEEIANVVSATVNTVTISFSVAPSSNQYKVTVLG